MFYIILVFLCKQSVSGSRKKVLNNAIKFVCFTYFLHQRSPIKIFKELKKWRINIKHQVKTQGVKVQYHFGLNSYQSYPPILTSQPVLECREICRATPAGTVKWRQNPSLYPGSRPKAPAIRHHKASYFRVKFQYHWKKRTDSMNII